MRPHGGRAKKLIVAFHFQFSDQAKWRCDVCREKGLEQQRACGFLSKREGTGRQIVWARGNVAVTECPRSLIRAESLEFLERYYAWKISGKKDLTKLSARQAEAFLILENEWKKEAEKTNERA